MDYLTNGFEPGDFILFSGAPSMGEDALIYQIAAHIAETHQKTAAIFSYDSPSNSVAATLLFSRGRIEYAPIRNSHLNLLSDEFWQAYWSKCKGACEELSKLDILIEGGCDHSLNELVDECMRLKAEQPALAVVAINNIDQLRNQVSFADRLDAHELSATLKELAGKLQVTIVATVNTLICEDERIDKRPSPGDFRIIGRYDRHADVVCGLYRESYYDPKCEDRNLVELLVLRNQKGPLSSIDLIHFQSEHRFENRCYSINELTSPNL